MDTSRERYEDLQERIKHRESRKEALESGGAVVPSRLRSDLAEFRMQAEEIRRFQHREWVREAEESRKATRRRDLQERARAEWRRIESAPSVDPSEIRARREALGVTQFQLDRCTE